jgi:hypothetical protein
MAEAPTQRVSDRAGGNPGQQAKAVILDLITAAGGKLSGHARLDAAFYFAHIYLWRDADKILTDHAIIRTAAGPAISDGNDLLADLVHDGKLRVISVAQGPFEDQAYEIPDPGPFADDGPRARAIRDAVEFVSTRTDADLLVTVQRWSLSWRKARDGAEMDIFIDTLTGGEYADIRKAVARVREREEQDVG